MRHVLLRPIGIAPRAGGCRGRRRRRRPDGLRPGGAAGANAWAVRILFPHGRDAAAIVAAASAASSASRPSFAYPATAR